MRTLKGIDVNRDCDCCVSRRELRKEATKWINSCDKSDFWDWMRKEKGFDYEDESKEPLDFIESFVEYFFNLKDVNVGEGVA